MVAAIVLIASFEHLQILQQHSDLSGAQAFADTDAIKALDAITRHPPKVIALEKFFAASARGAAFINRVKADPTVSACEIRIVESDAPFGRTPSRAASAGAESIQRASAVALESPPAPAAALEVSPAAVALDQAGTRRAPRFDLTRTVEVLIDGNPATLVDISAVGAQVVSLSSLRPNQRVRMSLIDAERPIRFNGVVAWATFEMPKEGPRYRAGIDFFDAAPEVVERFIEILTR